MPSRGLRRCASQLILECGNAPNYIRAPHLVLMLSDLSLHVCAHKPCAPRRITLVEALGHVLTMFDPGLVEYAEDNFRREHVELRTCTRVTASAFCSVTES